MMHQWYSQLEWKYFRIQLVFFLVFYYFFPILTDIEYDYNEMHNVALFSKNLIFNLVYGTAYLLPGIVYYSIVCRSLLNGKKALFALYTVLFLIGMHFYMTGVYLTVSHIAWLPEKLRHDALQWAQAKVVHFSIIYMFRELLCLGALAYFIHSARQEEQMRRLKEQQLVTELTYLKAQLHPHFFFNTMNNIYALALKKSEQTAPLVARLAEMMRYILHEGEQLKVFLDKEIAFLTNYVDAERIRHKSCNQITFDVQGMTSGASIAPLLLLPFIENAFKHGLMEETEQGFVHIVVFVSDKELILQVSNSKPAAIEPAAIGQNLKGIGLQNAVKRLNLLYPERHVLNIKDEQKTYRLNLSLQLHD